MKKIKTRCIILAGGSGTRLFPLTKFVETIEKRQGLKLACIERGGVSAGLHGAQQLEELAKSNVQDNYGRYFLNILHYDRSRSQSDRGEYV